MCVCVCVCVCYDCYCIDIDECSEGTDSCGSQSLCVNTPGSFNCYCNSGYKLTADGRSCIGKK